MAENTIKTRIVLRNDEQSAWDTSTKPLLKGEVAVSYVGGGKAELRFGQIDSLSAYKDGVKLQISADQVVGLNDTITSLSTTHYETDDIATLSASDYVNGDTAVEIKTIADDKVSYTAYVYDKKNSAWKAMDGNYRADNVYFDEDIPLAGEYTQVGNIKISDGTLSAKGKTVEELMSQIFDKTVDPTEGDAPSALITLSNAGLKEYGTKITPNWSVSYTQGKYNQSWNGEKIDDGTTATAYSITDGTNTSTASSGTFPEITVTTGMNYTVSGTVNYSDGDVAKNNKGKDSTVQRAAGSVTAQTSSAITCAKPRFYMFTSSKIAHPTAVDTKDSVTTKAADKWVKEIKTSNTTSFVAPTAYYQLFYAVPHNANQTKWTGVDGTGVNVLPVMATETISCKFADATTETYDLFIVENASAYSNLTCTMKYSK